MRDFVGPVLLSWLLLFLTRGSDGTLQTIYGGSPIEGQEYPFFLRSSARITCKLQRYFAHRQYELIAHNPCQLCANCFLSISSTTLFAEARSLHQTLFSLRHTASVRSLVLFS